MSDTGLALLEQEAAERLLRAALAEGPANAYLFAGPPGVGKRSAALAFAACLLGEPERVLRRQHPDLYVLEPLGDQIRIDAVRALRRDLHMRPFESSRRVYVVLDADLMNEDAADALLKDLEEPPAYAVVVLLATKPERLPLTIRSRCQHVPFQRLSRRTVEAWLGERRPELEPAERSTLARVAGGRLDRAERLLDEQARSRRARLVELARAVYLDPEFDPGEAARELVGAARAAGQEAARADPLAQDDSPLPAGEREQRRRRVARGAEREAVLTALELLAGWYRDLVAAAAGAPRAVIALDQLDQLSADAERVTLAGAARALEALVETRRTLELNVTGWLALEALFVELRAAMR